MWFNKYVTKHIDTYIYNLHLFLNCNYLKSSIKDTISIYKAMS